MYLFMGGVGDIYQAMFPSLQNCIENVVVPEGLRT